VRIKYDNKLIDLQSLSHAELVELRFELQTRQDIIKTQLARARRKANRTRIYADSATFTTLESECRNLGRKIQAIQIQAGITKRAEGNERQVTFERLFVDFAKQILNQQQWDSIVTRIVEAERKASGDVERGVR